ncbi:GDP-D-glucose phosphorylase 1 isoform X2 [Penaeus vannamei]|uniref:GDP-D-glucose phosphorylase 1 isoform X2 n=1 Tax=Penaeus vannamei TaxID=6689 RepID=UPI00387F809D
MIQLKSDFNYHMQIRINKFSYHYLGKGNLGQTPAFSSVTMECNGTNDLSDLVLLYTKDDFTYNTSNSHKQEVSSGFDTLLKRGWEAAMEAGIFNYKVDNVETKIIPGKYHIVAQMNANRFKLRRKPDEIVSVVQPFDPKKFNFTKIKNEEILMNLHYGLSNEEEEKVPQDLKYDLEATLLINNAPICYGHSLLVPFLDECRPQVLDYESLIIGIHSVLLSNTPNYRLAFNSLCGYASVNHLHFHLYYLPHRLYLEDAECELLAGPCYVFKDYHSPGFVFFLKDGAIEELARNLMKITKMFIEKGVAHNMFVTRGVSPNGNIKGDTFDTIRVVVWARKPAYGIKDVSVFAPAVCELAGHVPVYCEYDCKVYLGIDD